MACAVFVLVPAWPRVYAIDDNAEYRAFPIYLAHVLVMLIAFNLSWAFVAPGINAVWLQRIAATLVVAVTATAVYQFALPRLLGDSTWAAPSRLFCAIGGVASVGLLVLLMGYELVSYNPPRE